MVYYMRADYGRHSYPQVLAWMLIKANVRNERINRILIINMMINN